MILPDRTGSAVASLHVHSRQCITLDFDYSFTCSIDGMCRLRLGVNTEDMSETRLPIYYLRVVPIWIFLRCLLYGQDTRE